MGGKLWGTHTAPLLGTLERGVTLDPRPLGRRLLIADRCLRSGAEPLPGGTSKAFQSPQVKGYHPESPGQRSPTKDPNIKAMLSLSQKSDLS